MSQRIPMTSGDEFDAFTGWRRVLSWRAGERKAIKRRYNRRARRVAKVSEQRHQQMSALADGGACA
jgi:hypothetical protein